MLFLHELHTVAGAHEDAFEAAFRDRWLPAVAEDDGARFAWFLRLAFGTGRAYQVVTITALADGGAYERLARRVQEGDLRAWAGDVDRSRHEVRGKLLFPVGWSPPAIDDLGSVPVEPVDHDPVLYMEDSAWPHEAKLDEYLEAARTHYAPSLQTESHPPLLTLRACWQAALGAPRRREVVLWQRVEQPTWLPAMFTRDLPPEATAPGTWMHDALAVRDDWESRLLRSARWSPLA